MPTINQSNITNNGATNFDGINAQQLCHKQLKARALLTSGLSIIPVTGKVATITWGPFQARQATAAESDGWFSAKSTFELAIVCGQISGNLFVFDLEFWEIYQKWRQLCVEHGKEELLKTLPVVRTGGGGTHVYCRLLSRPPGGKKFAYRLNPEDPKKPILLAESRGEGNYVKAYDLIQGSLHKIPVISDEDFSLLEKLAIELDEMPKKTYTDTGNAQTADSFERDYFRKILPQNDFKLVRKDAVEDYWQKPGSSNDGHHVTTNYNGCGKLRCFSTTCPPFTENRTYSLVAVVALLNHGGDFSAAAEALHAEGYGLPGLDDIGNAQRFVETFGAEVLWVSPMKKWFVWDGRRWIEDKKEKVMELAKQTARGIYKEAANA